MAHPKPVVQSLQNLHYRPGIAGAFRSWQQLLGMQLESHRAVPGHPPGVLEAKDLFQAQIRVERPKCRLRVLLENPETPVEPWQELLYRLSASPMLLVPASAANPATRH